jgi:hypothetical protein
VQLPPEVERSADDGSESDDESITDMAMDLAAVADHCDIAIPALYLSLRRAASTSMPRPAAAPSSAPTATSVPMPASSIKRVSPLNQINERAPLIASTPTDETLPRVGVSTRIRIAANPVLFGTRALNEAESRGSVLSRSGLRATSVAQSSSLPKSNVSGPLRGTPPKSADLSGPPAVDRTAPGPLEAPLAIDGEPPRRIRFRRTRSTYDALDDVDHRGGLGHSPDGAASATHSGPLPTQTSNAKSADGGNNDDDDDDDEDQPARGVRWADEIKSVRSYEVDNSVFITIEYARPFVGWLCLVIAVAIGSFDGVIGHYVIGSGVNPYAAATWDATAQAAFGLVLFLVYMATVGGLSRSEWRYLTSANGWAQVAIVAFMFMLMSLAKQSTEHMTHESRPFTLTAIHPLLIAGFGMVFKNTVFYEEIAGIIVLLIGFGMAMLPADIHANRWVYAEVVSFSYGIFTASFLFACTRARARVPIPLLFGALSFASLLLQLPVAKIQHCTFDTDPVHGVAGFVHRSNIVPFAFTAALRPIMWLCYLLALRFLPPVTISAAMVIRPILSAFGVHLAFHVTDVDDHVNNNPPVMPGFNPTSGGQRFTSFWQFLAQSGHDATPAPSPSMGALYPAPTPSMHLGNRGQEGPTLPGLLQKILKSAGDSAGTGYYGGFYTPAPPSPTINNNQTGLFTPLWTVGACIAVSATIYVIYISSIKRQKVELLLRALSKRRKPRNPYTSRRRVTSIRTFRTGLLNEDGPGIRDPDDDDDTVSVASGVSTASSGSGGGKITPPAQTPGSNGADAGPNGLSPIRSPLVRQRPGASPVPTPPYPKSPTNLASRTGSSVGSPPLARTPPRRASYLGAELSTSPKWATPSRPGTGTEGGSASTATHDVVSTAQSSNTLGDPSYYDDW